jgi:hypothetical protein
MHPGQVAPALIFGVEGTLVVVWTRPWKAGGRRSPVPGIGGPQDRARHRSRNDDVVDRPSVGAGCLSPACLRGGYPNRPQDPLHLRNSGTGGLGPWARRGSHGRNRRVERPTGHRHAHGRDRSRGAVRALVRLAIGDPGASAAIWTEFVAVLMTATYEAGFRFLDRFFDLLLTACYSEARSIEPWRPGIACAGVRAARATASNKQTNAIHRVCNGTCTAVSRSLDG